MSKWVVWVFACLACAASSSSCIAGGADAVLLDKLTSGVLVQGAINAAVELPDGSRIVGGNFIRINGVAKTSLARIDPQGNVDPVWGPRLGEVSALAVDASGTVYAGGNFLGSGANPVLVRIPPSASGAVDPAYQPVFDTLLGPPVTLLASPDGSSLYVSLRSVGGTVMKLRQNGTADGAWSFALGGTVRAMVLDGSGRLYVGGSLLTSTGQPLSLGRVDATSGQLDADWRPDPDALVWGLAFDAESDMLYVGGQFSRIGGSDRRFLARMPASSNGAIDAAWQPQIDAGGVGNLVLQGDHVYVAVLPVPMFVQSRSLRRIDIASGVVDTAWRHEVDGTIQTLRPTPGGGVFAGGMFQRVGGVPALGGAEIPEGTDEGIAALEAGYPGVVYAMARQPNGGTIVAGYFSWIGGQPRRHLARLGPDLEVDPDWDPSPDNPVEVLETDDHGNVYAAGVFLNIGGAPYRDFAKLEGGATGRALAWPTFSWPSVRRMRYDGHGNLFVSGSFDLGDGLRRPIIKIRVNGAEADHVAQEWEPSLSIGAFEAAGQHLYVGSASGIRRLSTSGTGAVDPGWAVLLDAGVTDLAFDGHRHLYATGGFTSVAGWPLARMARVDLDGPAVDTAWAPRPDAAADEITLDGKGLPLRARYVHLDRRCSEQWGRARARGRKRVAGCIMAGRYRGLRDPCRGIAGQQHRARGGNVQHEPRRGSKRTRGLRRCDLRRRHGALTGRRTQSLS